MDFNKGVIEDQSENKIPCGIEGVVSLSNLAYFNGASRIIFWRYTNFDFQRSITLKFRFKSQSQSRNAPHPLVTNCGTGHDEPSVGLILNSFADVLAFLSRQQILKLNLLHSR
jgi:muramoyltetrapeptide carboxypeptidase LdcA involved in peptidoglycan recycling